jgi:hypothetical protein
MRRLLSRRIAVAAVQVRGPEAPSGDLHAVPAGAKAVARPGRAFGRNAEPRVDTRSDVVDVAQRLPHLGKRLLQSFGGRLQQLLDAGQRAPEAQQQPAQAKRDDERRNSQRQPQQVQQLASSIPPRSRGRNLTQSYCSTAALGPGPWQAIGQKLEQACEHERGEDVRLTQPECRQAKKIPQLAEAETDRCQDQHQQVVARAAIGRECVQQLRDDQDQQRRHDQAGRRPQRRQRLICRQNQDLLRTTSPDSSTNPGWGRNCSVRGGAVGCPGFSRWVPCFRLSRSRPAGVWAASLTPRSRVCNCWATRT